jgi:hypothetical protein
MFSKVGTAIKIFVIISLSINENTRQSSLTGLLNFRRKHTPTFSRLLRHGAISCGYNMRRIAQSPRG